jgi:nucleotide-binding universal stress UspA family protein
VSADLIISYDGTPNDDDAIALGRMLAAGGASAALAYVRHAREFDPRREELAAHDAEQRLARGAALLGDPEVPCHVVLGPSTADSLAELAAREGAALVVFGSDYRTPPGHAEPPTSAQHLIEGGAPVAVAIAAAGLRLRAGEAIGAIAVPLAGPRNDAARETAAALAQALGASLVDGDRPADLIVVGSKPDAPAGRIALGGEERSELSRARSSVLILPASMPLAL